MFNTIVLSRFSCTTGLGNLYFPRKLLGLVRKLHQIAIPSQSTNQARSIGTKIKIITEFMFYSSQSTLTIQDLFKGDLQLASPPNIYFVLKKTVDDPNSSLRDAAAVIENDAALSVKLLKIVNSAFYGFPRQITSLEHAVSLIGRQELQNLVFSSVIIDRFSDLPGNVMSMHDFWARNLRCALIARELDKMTGKNYANIVFLCGLIHNIGQLVLFRRIPLLAREVYLLMQSQAEDAAFDDEIRLEQKVIGFDHFMVGAELCRLWNLPEVIVESIRLHLYQDDLGPYCTIASIVRLAQSLSQIDQPSDRLAENSLGLSTEQLSVAVTLAYQAFDDIFKIFYPLKS